jgi:hypothetical protein
MREHYSWDHKGNAKTLMSQSTRGTVRTLSSSSQGPSVDSRLSRSGKSSSSSSSSSTPSSERRRRYQALVRSPKRRTEVGVAGSGSRSSKKSTSAVKSAASVRSFSKLPHNKQLVAAGLRSGQKVRVGDKAYVVERRPLGKANILAVRRVVPEGAKPKRSRRVPPMGKADKPGTRKTFRGREFELVQGPKMRRWKQIGGPPMTPRSGAAQKKKPQKSRSSPSAAVAAAARRSDKTRSRASSLRSLESRLGGSTRSRLIIPPWHKHVSPMGSPVRSGSASRRSASRSLSGSAASSGPDHVVALDAECFSFVVKPKCQRMLLE